MSEIGSSENGNKTIQAAYGQPTGSTVTITTVAATSAKTAAAIDTVNDRLCRIVSPVAVRLAFDTFATVTAAVTDMALQANKEEYFMVKAGHGIAAYDAGAGAAVIEITKM